MPKRSKKKYLGHAVTGSHIPTIGPEEDAVVPTEAGKPPYDIATAIKDFLKNELSRATYLAFRFYHDGYSIRIETNPKYTDHNAKAVFTMFGEFIELMSVKCTQRVEYADPNLFDLIERFINIHIL